MYVSPVCNNVAVGVSASYHLYTGFSTNEDTVIAAVFPLQISVGGTEIEAEAPDMIFTAICVRGDSQSLEVKACDT